MARIVERLSLEKLVIEVKLPRCFRLRMWAARKLITAAALVLGCGIKIEEEQDA